MTEPQEMNNTARNDQIMSMWQDTVPIFMKSIYDGFVRAGFNEEQSLKLAMFMWEDNQKRLLPPKPHNDDDPI